LLDGEGAAGGAIVVGAVLGGAVGGAGAGGFGVGHAAEVGCRSGMEGLDEGWGDRGGLRRVVSSGNGLEIDVLLRRRRIGLGNMLHAYNVETIAGVRVNT